MILHDYFPKNIKAFNKNKNKISQNLLILGSGRWAKVILDEITKNFPNLKIYLYSNNFTELEKWIKNEKYYNVFLIDSLQKIKKIKCKFAIIANKNKSHFSSCCKLLKLNFNVLVEKPFTLKFKDTTKLLKISSQKKLFLLISLQFFYAKYFYFIKKKFLKKSKINKISIQWFDRKNEIKNKILKIHDVEIDYVEDVFYHLYSILEVLLGKGDYEFKRKNIVKRGVNTLFFNYQKRQIILRSSRTFSTRKRIIKIYYSKNKKLFINFSKDSKIQAKINKYLIKFPEYICDTTLKYQLFFFLNLKKYESELLLNDVRNLNNLFLSLKKLKKVL